MSLGWFIKGFLFKELFWCNLILYWNLWHKCFDIYRDTDKNTFGLIANENDASLIHIKIMQRWIVMLISIFCYFIWQLSHLLWTLDDEKCRISEKELNIENK